ncbi:hypothetical protein HanIR_Chr11g0550001 [Helianthus annuus]|nr:hypothetical protein HanIR_Chr11g0550001 [Helianthus annuus]
MRCTHVYFVPIFMNANVLMCTHMYRVFFINTLGYEDLLIQCVHICIRGCTHVYIVRNAI